MIHNNMKDKLNYFFDKMSLWYVFLIGIVFFGIFASFILYFNFKDLSIINKLIECGFAIGTLLSAMLTSTISMARASDKFWKAAGELEKLIIATNNKVELTALFNNEFQQLRKLSMGNPHTLELSKLYYTLTTKIKFIND